MTTFSVPTVKDVKNIFKIQSIHELYLRKHSGRKVQNDFPALHDLVLD